LPFAYSETATNSSGAPVSTVFTSESTKLTFKMDQFVAVATVGATKRIDASVVIPSAHVSLGATANDAFSYVQNASSSVATGPISDVIHPRAGTASGVGDILLVGKGVVYTGEHATISAGMILRAPTGDDRNFLGSGAWGYNPYLVFSYLSKLSPHARFGYQWNSNTELNVQQSTLTGNFSKKTLPGGMQYDVGADYAMSKRLTVAADLLGNQYLNSPAYLPSSTNLATTKGSVTLPTSDVGINSYSVNDVSAGLKWNPFKNLVLSGNVLFQLNNSGLRARPTPLVGISYKF
jgi:hypothetical protein